MKSLTRCFFAQWFLMLSSAAMLDARWIQASGSGDGSVSALAASQVGDTSQGRYLNDSTRTCVKCNVEFPVGYNYCPFDGMQLPPSRLIDYEKEAPPGDFVPFEKEPVILKKVGPIYPESALRAGLEGLVVVKIWIDRRGKVRQVTILKSTAEVFNQSAIEAAKQFEFTPAYMNNGPVPVYVSFPFRYYLKDKGNE